LYSPCCKSIGNLEQLNTWSRLFVAESLDGEPQLMSIQSHEGRGIFGSVRALSGNELRSSGVMDFLFSKF
jgi:hypothetical protein